MKKNLYCYKGEKYDLSELSRLGGKSPALIYRRLRHGWSVEDAVDVPAQEEDSAIPKCWKGKSLRVVFREAVKGVYPVMQPRRGAVYIARPGGSCGGKACGTRLYFVVMLENGKPLIVYPGEFEILGVAVKGSAAYEEGEKSRQAEPGREEG